MPVFLNGATYRPTRPWVKYTNIYGVRYYATNTTNGECLRLHDAVGKTAVAQITSQEGYSDFDAIGPWASMTMVNVIGQDITANQGEDTFKLDGSNGDVKVKIPKFYFKLDVTTEYTDYFVSLTKFEGFSCSPAHYNFEAGEELDAIYVDRYVLDSAYVSRSKVTSSTHVKPTARTNITAKGAGHFQFDQMLAFVLQVLYLVEYADTNSVKQLGKGKVSTSAIVNGGTDAMLFHSGCISNDGASAMQYRYIENLYMGRSFHMDGINRTQNSYEFSMDYSVMRSKYADRTTMTMPATYSEAFKLGSVIANNVDKSSYYSDFVYNKDYNFIRAPKLSDLTGNGNNKYCGTLRHYGVGSSFNYTYSFGSTETAGNINDSSLFSYCAYIIQSASPCLIRGQWLPNYKIL